MKLFCRTYGQGKPLMILHGLFGQSDNWISLARKFAEQGFEVFVPDLRNHGLSPHAEEWNYEVMAEDVRDLLREYNLEKIHLVGHSMGGKVAMYFALRYPELVDHLVIVDIAPRYYPPHHGSVIKALQEVNFDLIQTRKEAEQILELHMEDLGIRQFLLKNIYWKDSANNRMAWRFNLDVICRHIEAVGEEAPFDSAMMPTLVIFGTKANYVTSEDEIDFEKRFPLVHFQGIDAGHWVHAEKPEEFFQALMAFIG